MSTSSHALSHLDRAVPGRGNPGDHLDGLAEILALDEEEASDPRFGLGERTSCLSLVWAVQEVLSCRHTRPATATQASA